MSKQCHVERYRRARQERTRRSRRTFAEINNISVRRTLTLLSEIRAALIGLVCACAALLFGFAAAMMDSLGAARGSCSRGQAKSLHSNGHTIRRRRRQSRGRKLIVLCARRCNRRPAGDAAHIYHALLLARPHQPSHQCHRCQTLINSHTSHKDAPTSA